MSSQFINASPDDLKAEWKRISKETGSRSGYGKGKELRYLVGCLLEHETVEALSDGLVSGKGCLVVVTSDRLLIIRSGMLSGTDEIEFGLSHIVGVDVKNGMVLAEISVKTHNEEIRIKNLAKQAARYIAQKIRSGKHLDSKPQKEPFAPVSAIITSHTDGESTSEIPTATILQNNAKAGTGQVAKRGSGALRLAFIGLLTWGVWSWLSGNDEEVNVTVADVKIVEEAEAFEMTDQRVALNSGATETEPQTSATSEVASNEPSSGTGSQPSSPLGTYYVTANSLNERSAPNGEVVNKVHRGQALKVTEIQNGWARVTEDSSSPRWVSLAYLSREKPEELPQPSIPTENIDGQTAALPKGSDLKYSVIDSDVIPGTKLSLVVRLSRKASEKELTQIAQELKNATRDSYARIFITHYLPGIEPGAGAWATTHFNPSLKVAILGMTQEQAESLARTASTASQDLIGVWLVEAPALPNRTTLYRKGGKIFQKQEFTDGGVLTDEMIERPSSSGRRFDTKEPNAWGDYLLLKPSGFLEVRDSEGLITTARPIS